MEKRYKYYTTKSEKIFLVLTFLLIFAVIIWMIWNKRYALLFFIILPQIAVLATSIYRFYVLTDDNMLVIKRYIFRSAFKPISVNQITRIAQQYKNKTILIYNRDGLRGDIILKLSETDLKEFLDELEKRNPAIEMSN